jgi:hypothetical protein
MTCSALLLKGGKFEIDRDGFKGAENSSVQKRYMNFQLPAETALDAQIFPFKPFK